MLRARNILITSFIIDSTDIIYTENMLHGRHSVISIIDVVGVMALIFELAEILPKQYSL